MAASSSPYSRSELSGIVFARSGKTATHPGGSTSWRNILGLSIQPGETLLTGAVLSGITSRMPDGFRIAAHNTGTVGNPTQASTVYSILDTLPQDSRPGATVLGIPATSQTYFQTQAPAGSSAFILYSRT